MTHDERICPYCEEASNEEVWRHALYAAVLFVIGVVVLVWHP